MSEEDEMLPTARAAQIVGVHPATLRGYEKRGLIEARRTPGGRRRWRRGDLQDLNQKTEKDEK